MSRPKRRRVAPFRPTRLYAALHAALESGRGGPAERIAGVTSQMAALDAATLRAEQQPVVTAQIIGAAAASPRTLLAAPDTKSLLVQALHCAAPAAEKCVRKRTGANARQLREIEAALVKLVRLYRDRGLDLNAPGLEGIGGDLSVTATNRTPLVEASRLGLRRVVRALLDCGALPDMSDGEGNTALHAACGATTSNPSMVTAPQRALLGLLFSRAVTADRDEWAGAGGPMAMAAAGAAAGAKVHIECASVKRGSALCNAVINRNVHLAWLLTFGGGGACVTDDDYRRWYGDRKARKEVRRLLPIVAAIQAARVGSVEEEKEEEEEEEDEEEDEEDEDDDGGGAEEPPPLLKIPVALTDFKSAARGVAAAGVAAWHPSLHWSFPQTFRRTARWLFLLSAVSREHSRSCFFFGLPPEVLRKVLACCSRSWFPLVDDGRSTSTVLLLPRFALDLDMGLRT